LACPEQQVQGGFLLLLLSFGFTSFAVLLATANVETSDESAMFPNGPNKYSTRAADWAYTGLDQLEYMG